MRNDYLVELDVEDFPIDWPWYIGYPAGKRLSVVVKTFLDFIKAAASKHTLGENINLNLINLVQAEKID